MIQFISIWTISAALAQWLINYKNEIFKIDRLKYGAGFPLILSSIFSIKNGKITNQKNCN